PLMSLVSIVLMILAAAGLSVLVSLIVERIAYRPLRNAPRLVPLISAIGASFFLEYTFRGLFGPGVYAYPPVKALEGEWNILGISILKVQVVVAVAAFVMMAILYAVVMYTKVGKAMRAVS